MLTPEEAAIALQEAHRARSLGWRVVSGQTTRLPMIWWGLAWLVTYPAAQFLPLVPAMVVGAAAATAAFTLTRIGARWDPTPGATGWGRQMVRAWYAVLAAAFVINVIASPAPAPVYFLIPGTLWGLAMLLYALVAGDLVLGLLGAGIVVLAAALRTFLLDDSLLIFGLVAGGAMTTVGLVRLLRSPASTR